MKRLIFVIFFVFAFCLGNTQSKISIKGKIKKSKTRKVWIYNYNKSISDTVKLNLFRNFNYSNSFLENELCFIKPLESSIPLVFNLASKSEIKFKTELPDIYANLSLKGNKETTTASDFFKKMSQFQFQISETENKLYKDETADGQYYYDSVLVSIKEEAKAFKSEFILENQNTSSLLLMNDFVDFENEYDLLLDLEKGLSKNFKNTKLYEKVEIGIYKHQMYLNKVEGKGDNSPILILPGVDGKDVSMADLEGNYILIDFWASWCKPCRAEHPRLIKLYEKYNSLGFEIYSISLDKSKENWINAIKEDQLSWSSHVSNLMLFNCPTVKMYNIQALPSNVLIDRVGNVIEINLRGKKLEDKLKQIFDGNN